MTEKRFIIMDNLPKGTHSSIWDKQKQHNQGSGDELWLGEVVAMLNEGVIIVEENEQLRTKNNAYIQDIEVFKEENTHLKLENEELKQIILFANELIKTQHITQHDYWKFRTLCKENGVDLG